MAAIAARSSRFVRDTMALLCAAPTVTCTFESGLCSWKMGGGRRKWVRGTRTPSSSTGAAKAYAGRYFMFLETSGSSKGWTSYLTHAVKAGYESIAFAYHMHGATMGELRVEAQVGGQWRTVWKKSGQQQKNQADKFITADVRPPPSARASDVCVYATRSMLPSPHTPFTSYVPCHCFSSCECSGMALHPRLLPPAGRLSR